MLNLFYSFYIDFYFYKLLIIFLSRKSFINLKLMYVKIFMH